MTTADKHQLRICRETVKYPEKGIFLGGPSVEEAKETLRTKFKWSEEKIAKLEK